MKIWNDFIDKQEKLLGKDQVSHWLRSLKVLRFDARNLYLEAKDAFHLHWFEQHIRKAAKELTNGSGKPISIHISAQNSQSSDKKSSIKRGEMVFKGDHLIPQKTFSSFYVSEENRLTYELLSHIEKAQFNPIFLYGPKGSGKSHLLMSTAKYLKDSSINAFYVRAETFTSHVVSAIQFGNMQEFRKNYRSIDALILDNINVFGGKNATQEEFFHTFNELHTRGKIILIASPVAPQDLMHMEPRLISRFEWGLSLNLEPPSKKELKEILQKKAKEFSYPLSEKRIQFLIHSFHSLESLHTAFDALLLRNPKEDEALEKVLQDLLQKERKESLTIEKVLEKVSLHLEISPQDILGKSQEKKISLGRRLAMFFLRYEMKMSFIAIGRAFCKDHSTVMSAVKKVEKESPPILDEIRRSLKLFSY